MSGTKHTPGPWTNSAETHFQGGEPYSQSIYVTLGAQTITIGIHQGKSDQEEIIANAKLIAAAPDMLEALRPLADPDFLEALRHDITSLSKAQEEAIIAAFKKATE